LICDIFGLRLPLQIKKVLDAPRSTHPLGNLP